jgi:hypothetical protein
MRRKKLFNGLPIVHPVRNNAPLEFLTGFTFRFEFWLKPIELSDGKDVENEEKPSPENPFPEGRE